MRSLLFYSENPVSWMTSERERRAGRFLWSVTFLPDHSFKQVLDDEVGLSHHDQQGHMGPSKLE